MGLKHCKQRACTFFWQGECRVTGDTGTKSFDNASWKTWTILKVMMWDEGHDVWRVFPDLNFCARKGIGLLNPFIGSASRMGWSIANKGHALSFDRVNAELQVTPALSLLTTPLGKLGPSWRSWCEMKVMMCEGFFRIWIFVQERALAY